MAFVTLIGMLAWAPLHFSSSVVHLWEELCAEIGRWELWAVEGHLCNEQGPSRAVARCATDPGSELATEVTIEHHLRSSRHLFGHPELSQAKRLAHLKVPISELVFRERFCRKAISGKKTIDPTSQVTSAGTFGQVERLQGQQSLCLASTLWQARFLIQ